jgi:hypothetical protein
MKLAAMIILLIAMHAHGRVGETLDQCIARYGQPLKPSSGLFSRAITGPDTTNATFKYQGWILRVGFYRGYACDMHYQKEFRRGHPDAVTDAEFLAILQAYQAEPWKGVSDPVTLNPLAAVASAIDKIGKGDSWKSQKGFIAYRRAGTSIVRVVNPAALAALEEQKRLEIERNALPVPKF